MVRTSKMKSMSDQPGSPIAEYFEGRHVFVTGATGFMGKVLVEKLLRSCPRIGKIYLLMREKKGKDAKSRHQEYLDHVIFDRLRTERPDFTAQLQTMSGDVQLEGLGLDTFDHAHLVKTVQVVFHCAANVRFDEPLGVMINMNTRGSLRMLKLAGQMSKLEAYVHVSTSYCHCYLDVLEEKVYPALNDPHKIMQIVEWMGTDVVRSMTPALIHKLPNTYSYSKNLSEQLVSDCAGKFPIGIARPSIVTNSWREPVPGWVENLNGPVGLLVGAGKGVIRSMHCQPDYNADLIPVDIAINIIIGLAWQVAVTKPAEPLVVNATESGDNPITWNDMVEKGRALIHQYPFSQCLWYPNGTIKSSKLAHNFAVIFFHFLPAYILDGIFRLCGHKPFMVTAQRRIQGGLEILQYYTTKKWDFRNANQTALREAMSREDRETFYTDIREVDWDDYSRTTIIGTRFYLLKEDPSTLPQARRLNSRLKVMDWIVSALFYVFLIWVCLKCSGLVLGFLDGLVGGDASTRVGNVATLRPMGEPAISVEALLS